MYIKGPSGGKTSGATQEAQDLNFGDHWRHEDIEYILDHSKGAPVLVSSQVLVTKEDLADELPRVLFSRAVEDVPQF